MLAPKTEVDNGTSKPREKEDISIEQDGLDIEFREELHTWRKRQDTFTENITKAYALIFSHCNKTMQNIIEEHLDFETKVRDDPIELLKAIKTLMYNPSRANYGYASLTEALVRIITVTQDHDERLIDYTKRFKQSRDIVKYSLGTDILDKFVTNTKEY